MKKRINLLRTTLALAVLSLVTGCDYSLSPTPTDSAYAKKATPAARPMVMNGHHIY